MITKQRPPLSLNKVYYIGKWQFIPHGPLSDDNPLGKWHGDLKYSPRGSGVLQVLDWRLLTTEPGPLTLRAAAALFGTETIRRKMTRRNPAQMSFALAA